MRFSKYYPTVQLTLDDDWFDTLLTVDTNLAVDPFLVYEDTTSHWATAHDHVLSFFEIVFDLVRESGGNEDSVAWKKVQNLLLFPEPSEFCLGVAEASPMGSGAGRVLQEGMLDGVRTALGLGIDRVEHMEMLALFQGGMGLDRISDAVCNILKSYFIKYTQDICHRHNIPMETFRVRNASWSKSLMRWQDQDVNLPANPLVRRRQPVLLVPKRFLKDIPVVTPNGFWNYAMTNHAEALRGDFNYDIATNVDWREKAKLARQNPDVVAQYLQKLETEDHDPYPVDTDPKLRIKLWERGTEIAERSPLSWVATKPEEFTRFVTTIINAFKHGIEYQKGWENCWHGLIALPEKKIQGLFRACAIHYCRANNVDLTGEANAGRGPVDFKFSQGWSARTVVEIKLMSNTKFWDGILAQTPEYALAEEVSVAFFVAIAHRDEDLEASQITKVKRAASLVATHKGVEVIPIVIDARHQDSASKLKAPKDLKDELKRPDEGDDLGDLIA